MHNIAVPVDLRTIVQVFVAQQIETMLADLFCPEYYVIGLRRKNLFQESTPCGSFRGCKEKAPLRPCRFALHTAGKIVATQMPKQIGARRQLLP